MKYSNQVNIALAAAGFAILVYVFSATFWHSEPVAPLQIESAELSPEMRALLLDTQPMMRSATTTRRQALEGVELSGRLQSLAPARGAQSDPRVQSAPGPPPPQGPASEMPVWNGPPLAEALANRGEPAERPSIEQITVPGEEDDSFPATVIAPSSSGPPVGAGPGSPGVFVEGRTFGRTRPLPPTDSGVETEKRDSSEGAPPPPVRSSLPPARPPQ